MLAYVFDVERYIRPGMHLKWKNLILSHLLWRTVPKNHLPIIPSTYSHQPRYSGFQRETNFTNVKGFIIEMEYLNKRETLTRQKLDSVIFSSMLKFNFDSTSFLTYFNVFFDVFQCLFQFILIDVPILFYCAFVFTSCPQIKNILDFYNYSSYIGTNCICSAQIIHKSVIHYENNISISLLIEKFELSIAKVTN